MMDNNRKTLNKREILMGHAYVFLFFFPDDRGVLPCHLHVEFGLQDVRAEGVCENQDEPYQGLPAGTGRKPDARGLPVPEDRAFQPGVYAQYEEDDIHYLINNLRNTYERNSWDKRYKLFMHIADFYAMWLSDKKQLWSIEQNIRLFKANLEECENRLAEERGRPALGN